MRQHWKSHIYTQLYDRQQLPTVLIQLILDYLSNEWDIVEELISMKVSFQDERHCLAQYGRSKVLLDSIMAQQQETLRTTRRARQRTGVFYYYDTNLPKDAPPLKE